MTRRTFVRLGVSGTSALAVLAGCANDTPVDDAAVAGEGDEALETAEVASEAGQASDSAECKSASDGASQVFFTHGLDSAALQAVFAALGQGLGEGRIGVKLSSGEPGGDHYLKADLISDLVHAVGGTIVECNTAYGGGRSTTEAHYEVAKDHGFTDVAAFQIMDEDGSLSLPVEGGHHLTEDLVGAHFADYDGFLVLSHFKGHAMAGFGGDH